MKLHFFINFNEYLQSRTILNFNSMFNRDIFIKKKLALKTITTEM